MQYTPDDPVVPPHLEIEGLKAAVMSTDDAKDCARIAVTIFNQHLSKIPSSRVMPVLSALLAITEKIFEKKGLPLTVQHMDFMMAEQREYFRELCDVHPNTTAG